MGVIFLTGMTGSGKSTVARELAMALEFECVDLDREIEQSFGTTITDIFERVGETGFRVAESESLLNASHSEAAVIALGAGALTRASNLSLVLERGLLVYLRAPLKLLVERTSQAHDRPLLAGIKTSEALALRLSEMLESRRSAYERAAVIVDVEGKSVGQIVDEILRRVAA